MPIEFSALHLNTSIEKELYEIYDITGRLIDFTVRRPILLFNNLNNLHWNLIRLIHEPQPEIQFFEPLG